MKRLPILLAATVACTALAQNAAPDSREKPLTQEELLKQIESFSPPKAPAATPAPADPLTGGLNPGAGAGLLRGAASGAGATSAGLASITPATPGGTMIGTGTAPAAPGEEKAKGPTIIDALEATFDQRANVAVFVGEVVVKDPEFNVWCDKLTAYLKHEDKTTVKGAKTTPKPVTPKPATPRPDGKSTPPPRGGGLDHAVAVCNEGHRVKITQDKVDAETGKIKHGIGFADWATYDANTGDVVLHGSPDVTQEQDRCIATAPETVMTLNRDGHMIAKGPHRTFIVDDTPPKADDGTRPATPRPVTPAPGVDSGIRSPQ